MRIFFATDIHGSEKCFLKFLNAADFYGAQVLILGGDITGKLMVPIIREKGYYQATFNGHKQKAITAEECRELEKQIRFAGFYPFHTTPDEVRELSANEVHRNLVFNRLMADSVTRWIETAEAKLSGKNIPCFIQPGNDDEMFIDELLGQSDLVQNPEGRIIELPGGYLLVSTGYANQTPWDCPRDLPEEDLQCHLAKILSPLENTQKAIFNFHCPPFNSEIDHAPELTRDLRPILGVGAPKMAPLGSKAVRQSIEEYQPLLGLHGHFHESRGISRLGRTLCLNPGSRYNEGILQGAIIDLKKNRVQRYQLTAG